MEAEARGDAVLVFLVALGVANEPPPLVFRLENAMNKMAYEDYPFIDAMTEAPPQGTENARFLLKFTSRNNLDEECFLYLDMDPVEEKSNLYLTIDPTKSTATLTAYESNEGGQDVWKSVNIYSVVPVPPTSDNISLIFGDAPVKYKGHCLCNFYPLQVEINRDFEIEDLLGQGAYGSVHRCVQNGVPCAVKIFSGNPSSSPCSEVQGMTKLIGAEKVVQMFSAWVQKHQEEYLVYISMEIFERSLEDYLTARVEVDLEKNNAIFIEIMTGVRCMHNAGVVHRDMKPGNILMDNDEHVAICDFGTCAVREDASERLYANQEMGTEYYSDPLMESVFGHTEKVDIYSAGVIYAEMHLLDVTKRRKLIRDINLKSKQWIRKRTYNFLGSSMWKDWYGDKEILRETLVYRASATLILNMLGERNNAQMEQSETS